MKEQIEGKIEELVGFIVNKPVARITLDDYTILSSELRDIRLRESQADNRNRMAELFAMANAPVSGLGSVK